MILHSITPPELPNSTMSIFPNFETLSATSIDDLISKIISNITDFAISLAIAIAVFYIGKFVIKKLHKIVLSVLIRREVDQSLSTFILSFVKIVLYFILIIIVIGILGIETTSFLALFASAGVAVGMALSGTLQNFAGGVLILLLKPFKVGDYIEAQGYAGTVTEIQIFHTIICTPDNKSIIIPNGGLSTDSINNYSREDYRRVDWEICLSYGNDIEIARRIILNILNSDERIVKNFIEDDMEQRGLSHKNPIKKASNIKTDRSPVVVLSKLADSSINLTARAWTTSGNYWAVMTDINEVIYNELPKHGLSFPFPQMDIHIINNK
ncbi:MAG: mechanosensitive ion channel [Bacteroidales bacterium]|nr:mechanosensitive ion channel [Bacteroidales bacterium]